MTDHTLQHIKAIIFDFGGVFDPQHEALQGFNEVAFQFGLDPEALYDKLYAGDAWQQAKTGVITGAQYMRLMMHELDPKADDVVAFRARLFQGHQLDFAVIRIARLLHERYPLALLSNATDELDTLLAQYELHKLFTVIINSAQVGVVKPDPVVYRLVLDGLGVAAHEALFIDDKPRNVTAAEALGIPSVLYTDAVSLEQTLVRLGLLDESSMP